MGGAVFLIAVVGGLIWYFVWDAKRRRAQRDQLWNAYQWSLQNMPYNPVARSQVVARGRAWYGYLRGGTVTMYDELAIQNDIKAAGG